MKLRINNRDLSYSIDTYGLFTGDSVEEMEREHYQTEYEMTSEELDVIEWKYNHSGIVRDLASASVNLLHNEFVEHGDGVVKSIELETSQSPQFYNYTTDSYSATWDVDVEKLREELKGRQQELDEFIAEQWSALDTSDTESEDYIVAMLDFWTQERYEVDDYNMAMWEVETEVYFDNMELTEEASEIVRRAIKRADELKNQTEMEF